jgi:hypothetical protein
MQTEQLRKIYKEREIKKERVRTIIPSRFTAGTYTLSNPAGKGVHPGGLKCHQSDLAKIL